MKKSLCIIYMHIEIHSKIYIWNYREKPALISTTRLETSIVYKVHIHFRYRISHVMIYMREEKKIVLRLGWLYCSSIIIGLLDDVSVFSKLMQSIGSLIFISQCSTKSLVKKSTFSWRDRRRDIFGFGKPWSVGGGAHSLTFDLFFACKILRGCPLLLFPGVDGSIFSNPSTVIFLFVATDILAFKYWTFIVWLDH